MKRFWYWLMHRRHADLDARVAEAQQRAASAEQEVLRSEQRQERARREVILPLKRAAEHNQFAEMIRQTITGSAHHNGGAA